MTGYTDCACRDCFEIAIGAKGEAFCHECEEAGCEGGESECSAPQAFDEPDCCTFHDNGGSTELVCGGDLPSTGGKHSRACAYHAGGDCTCGQAQPASEFD